MKKLLLLIPLIFIVACGVGNKGNQRPNNRFEQVVESSPSPSESPSESPSPEPLIIAEPTEEPVITNTPKPAKTTPKPRTTTTTTKPPVNKPTVRPGAFCKPAGATGYYNGKLYTCKTSATDSRLRWRQ